MTALRPSWHQWGIDIAQTVATRADCTRRQVGAVVFDSANRVLSVGYNGAPPGHAGCASSGMCPRGHASYEDVAARSSYDTGAGSCIAIHAEANALLYSDPTRRKGGWMSVTCSPCDGCWRLLLGSGLDRVVWPNEIRRLVPRLPAFAPRSTQ